MRVFLLLFFFVVVFVVVVFLCCCLFHYYYFPEKTGFAISCKLSPMETICMKCQNLFSGISGKNKENINLLSAELKSGK